MNGDVVSLVKHADQLFGKRGRLMSTWQLLSENFYVERADFTSDRTLGDDFAGYVTTSYPTMARRDLGNAIGSMLRPYGVDWFYMGVKDDQVDHAGKQWLELATKAQRRAMYDRQTGFMRAVKQGDMDFATFGQAVIQVEVDRKAMSLVYRNWHLRDVAWCEDVYGGVGQVYRKWEPDAWELPTIFKNVHHNITIVAAQNPYAKVKCMHVVVPSDMYKGEKKLSTPFVSLFIDCENKHVMEEVGVPDIGYVIPRWQTVSGSQYAYSPATVCAFPEARLLQAMTLTLLEAGEKAVNPPLIGVQEALRSDLQIFAGGFTAIDPAYDEKTGEVLRPLNVEKSALPMGFEMAAANREMIAQAFYLNKLSLPIMAGDMTATEVSQRVQEYIRQALPLFEPMEFEYNGALCEMTFNRLFERGAFGPLDEMPRSLSGQDIEFKFISPLQEAEGKKKAQTFLESKALLAAAVEADPSVIHMVDFKVAFREAVEGVGAPIGWMRSEEDADRLAAQQAAMMQQQQMLQTIGQGAAVAEQFGKASQALAA